MAKGTATLPGMEDATVAEIRDAALALFAVRAEKKELKEREDHLAETLLKIMNAHETAYYYDPERRILVEVEELEKVKVTLKKGKKSGDDEG
jgi:hypothetical protein